MKWKIVIRSLASIFIIIGILAFPIIAKRIFPLYYSTHIEYYSKQYNLDPYIVAALIKTESNFRPNAKSSKNAHGLMQITYTTGEWAAAEMKLNSFGTNKLLEPEYNIRMGCWYLNNLKKEFGNNMDLVLAAYNGGRGNVQKWLADSDHSLDGKNLYYIPFKETDKYVKRVKAYYNVYKFLYKNRFN